MNHFAKLFRPELLARCAQRMREVFSMDERDYADRPTTTTIDKLFLELSQFTNARTKRDFVLSAEIDHLRREHVRLQFALEQRERELTRMRHYASYLKCCAQSGEHGVHDFDAFLVRTQWPADLDPKNDPPLPTETPGAGGSG